MSTSDCVISVGSPLAAISGSPDHDMVVVAGRDVMSIIRVDSEEFSIVHANLRSGKLRNLDYGANDVSWHPSPSTYLLALLSPVTDWHLTSRLLSSLRL
jgi:hypothetical protein